MVGFEKGHEERITEGHWETSADDKRVNFYGYNDSFIVGLL